MSTYHQKIPADPDSRHIGVNCQYASLSEHSKSSLSPVVQIQQAIEIARRLNLIGPVADQPEYSMLKREKFEVEFEPLWR